MRVFIIFLICGYFSVIISSRPIVEGNDSETSDAEYEDSDDSNEDEDLSEDQESASNEAQIKAVNQPQALNHNIREERIDQNKAKFLLTGAEFDSGREPRKDEINLNVQNRDGFSMQSGNPKTYHNDMNKEAEANDELRENPNSRFEARDMNRRQDTNYPSESFIKINSENLNVARRDYNNEHVDSNEQPASIKQYYSTLQRRNKDIVDRKKYDNSCYTRDRRETQSLNSRENNGDINESSEISILKNIQMLSDKDLENLLNSLPEDKKALLRKIMDKREITKKAGAVDDNGYDTSKLDGSYSLDSNTFSSLSTNTDASDTVSGSGESSTKPQENENDVGKSENKAGLIANKNEQTFEVSIEALPSNTDTRNNANIVSKGTSKSDNKREINSDLHKQIVVQEDTKLGDDLNNKGSYDSLTDHDVVCSDNEGFFDLETDGSNTQKREVLQDISFANKDSIKYLEDSFPSAYGYEDINVNSDPLIRVKRTELNHSVKKRDLPPLINDKVPFVPVFEDKEPENVEVSEFEDKSFLNHAAVNVRDDRQEKPNKANLALESELNDNSELVKVGTDESSIGSDTDSILSSDEEAGDDIMYNSKIRNKRLKESTGHEKNNKKLIRSGRTIAPIDNESNLRSDNSIDTPQYHGEESFGTISHNSEQDLSRSKRIKRVKNVKEISS